MGRVHFEQRPQSTLEVRPLALRSEAFSPCNITGFFQIHRHQDPLQTGSTGASVAINQGVTTRVELRPARKSRSNVTFNGRALPDESVSCYVLRKYAMLAGMTGTINVSHECPLPTGCGYGSSGAGALSLSLAVNEVLGAPLRDIEAAQIAHISEIACGTGLGTVASVFSGGMTLRRSPGAPGHGVVQTLSTPSSLRVLSCSFGPLSTKKILGTKSLRTRFDRCAEGILQAFERDRSEHGFMALSRRFSNCIGLSSARLTSAIKRLHSRGLNSSMMMIGESLFLLAQERELPRLAQVLGEEGLKVVTSRVSRSGAQLT